MYEHKKSIRLFQNSHMGSAPIFSRHVFFSPVTKHMISESHALSCFVVGPSSGSGHPLISAEQLPVSESSVMAATSWASIKKSSWKKANPTMENKYTKIKAKIKVKNIDRMFFLTDIITLSKVSSLKIEFWS